MLNAAKTTAPTRIGTATSHRSCRVFLVELISPPSRRHTRSWLPSPGSTIADHAGLGNGQIPREKVWYGLGQSRSACSPRADQYRGYALRFGTNRDRQGCIRPTCQVSLTPGESGRCVGIRNSADRAAHVRVSPRLTTTGSDVARSQLAHSWSQPEVSDRIRQSGPILQACSRRREHHIRGVAMWEMIEAGLIGVNGRSFHVAEL